MRHTNARFRITVQLVDGETRMTEWAQTYSVAESELFDMQSDIAANIVHQLAPAVNDVELRRIEGALPTDLDAYHLTLRARDISFNMNPETFKAARTALLEAQSRDPGFALSFMLLADWHSITICQGWSKDRKEDEQSLQRFASDAVRISRESGRALSMLAHNQTIMSGVSEQFLDFSEKALRQAPNDAEALLWSVPTLAFAGQDQRAVDNARQAIALSPHDPYMFRYQHFLSIAQFANGDYLGAARSGQYSFQLNPLYTSNLRMTAASLVEIGELEEARRMAHHSKQLDPGFNVQAFAGKQPFKKIETGERYVTRLLEAGLPR